MAVAYTPPLQERELLEAARGGDQDAFRRIVEQHQAALHAHCYRMLGSLHDAEDALQNTLLRAWRALPSFGGRSSIGSWLYRIATNVCLDVIARRPKRVLPIDYAPQAEAPFDPSRQQPLVESVWVEPYPDESIGVDDGYAAPAARYEQREAVELAFIAALQHLPGSQRAVLILRDVLGFSAREVAESLDTTVASVNSSLQRARKAVADRLPEQSQQATLRTLGDDRLRGLVETYVDAWTRGDVDTLHELLAEDAVFSMPPWPTWWRGRETILANLAHSLEADECAEHRVLHTRVNGQPALAYYSLHAETGRWLPSAIEVLTFEDERITEITTFVSPELFAGFGLPPEHPAVD
jgi:RNA polymerase sigma-70 factor, ECF subfamily